MSKRTLVVALSVLAVTGIAIAAYPFLRSMTPSERSKAAATKISLLDFPLGTGREIRWKWASLFVLRMQNDEVRIFAIPNFDGAYRLPDVHWDRAYLKCKNFGADPSFPQVDDATTFQCLDPAVKPYWQQEWRWDARGKPLGRGTDPLPRVEYARNGDQLVLQSPRL